MSKIIVSKASNPTVPTRRTRTGKIPHIIRPDTSRLAKVLIFGPSGQGKTRLLGTAQDDPRTHPILILDYEGGMSTLAGRDVDITKVRSWGDYYDALYYLASGKHPYNSVGLDSISEAHIFSLLTQLDSGTRNRAIPDLLEQGDYGIALVQMRRLLRAFRDLPLHVFATCMARDEDDPREGRVKKPALAGALADEAPGIFEMVAYLAISDAEAEDGTIMTQRYLVLQNAPKIRTKVRAPWNTDVPDYIEAPTVTSILDLLGVTTVPQDMAMSELEEASEEEEGEPEGEPEEEPEAEPEVEPVTKLTPPTKVATKKKA